MTAHPHPHPRKKQTNKQKVKTQHHRKRLWSVLKMLIDGPWFLKEPNPKKKKKKKYHASFIPIEYLHLGQQTLLTESRKQVR